MSDASIMLSHYHLQSSAARYRIGYSTPFSKFFIVSRLLTASVRAVAETLGLQATQDLSFPVGREFANPDIGDCSRVIDEQQGRGAPHTKRRGGRLPDLIHGNA